MFSPVSPSNAVWSEFIRDIYLPLVYCRLFIFSGPLENVTLCIAKTSSCVISREGRYTKRDRNTRGNNFLFLDDHIKRLLWRNMQRENSSHICSQSTKKYIPIKLCPGTFEYQTATTLSERYLFKGATLIKKIKITTIETTFTQNRNQLGKIQYIEHARWNSIIKHLCYEIYTYIFFKIRAAEFTAAAGMNVFPCSV